MDCQRKSSLAIQWHGLPVNGKPGNSKAWIAAENHRWPFNGMDCRRTASLEIQRLGFEQTFARRASTAQVPGGLFCRNFPRRPGKVARRAR
jgi:hypothetical protein